MSTLALGLDRTALELKMYSREKEAVFFSFLLPILLLALFSTIFGGQFEGAPLLLLHSTGAKSGQERVHTMMYQAVGDGFAVFASKAGADTNPDWYHNLKANPEVTVEVGADAYRATAVEVTGDDRDALYAAQVARMPGFQTYADSTDRVIPVIALERAG